MNLSQVVTTKQTYYQKQVEITYFYLKQVMSKKMYLNFVLFLKNTTLIVLIYSVLLAYL